MAPVLGCIADDFTGATDLANMLVRGGLRTIQLLGVPKSDPHIPDVDAIVIALKSRTIEPEIAISQSLQSLEWCKNLEPNSSFLNIAQHSTLQTRGT